MSDNTEVDRLVRQIRDLRAEMVRRENIWTHRLRDADSRAENILRRTVTRFSPITADEWPKTERTVIEVSEVVYFRDFLRSLWRRLRRRGKLSTFDSE